MLNLSVNASIRHHWYSLAIFIPTRGFEPSHTSRGRGMLTHDSGGGDRGGDGWRRCQVLGGKNQGVERIRCGRKICEAYRERETSAGGRGRGGGEESIRRRVLEGGDGGGAAHTTTDPLDGPAGEAGENHKARHGEDELKTRELCSGEPALQPELGKSVSALRLTKMPIERRAGDPRESHAAEEDDDVEPRRVVTKNPNINRVETRTTQGQEASTEEQERAEQKSLMNACWLSSGAALQEWVQSLEQSLTCTCACDDVFAKKRFCEQNHES
ncbi:uncharacterized protein [Physcomitrium patens]|uniref:uncharacterized protein n=1 Tax=Physcomitrium patens TaxID=3218 RepID=UPI003CCCC3C2